MNEYLEQAKQALAEGRVVEIDTPRGSGSASARTAHESANSAELEDRQIENGGGEYTLNVYGPGRHEGERGPLQTSSAVDPAGARALLTMSGKHRAVFIGRKYLNPAS